MSTTTNLDQLQPCSTVRLILGDQLNARHSWYQSKNDDVLYLVAELKQEATYVRHHEQKILAFFAAMQGFANALVQAGHKVLYLTLDDTHPFATLADLLTAIFNQTGARAFQYQQPDEYRLAEQLDRWCGDRGNITYRCDDTEHFYLPQQQLPDYIKAGKHQRMEFFYRKLRKEFNLLMDGDQPMGGKWNYDQDNRQTLKPGDVTEVPTPLMFENPVADIRQRIARHNIPTFGKAEDQLPWPVNRQQSLQLLDYFCQHLLPNFGRYQDAMVTSSENSTDVSWSLYHSRLSFSINSKMLSPQQVVNSAIEAYHARPDEISIAQVEGFVRQILGWREFIRAIYWRNMPGYAQLNHLNAQRALPQWFWSGETNMHCMSQAITQSLDYAYAHHIQRLMITGNFCLLAGIHPDQVDQWYLGIYVDAIEWVEMPNTRGMSQFADGGLVGSKAYAASGNYVSKMSNYCKHCHYDVKQKTGERACPLNSLYWRFMHQHKDAFNNNPRNAMIYKNWEKQGSEAQQAVLDTAEKYLIEIEQL